MVALLLLALLAPPAAEHVTVYREAGHFGGWPANHGAWSWGDEILVGFQSAFFKAEIDRHAVDRERPRRHLLARSIDGGRTWTIEAPPQFAMREFDGAGPEPSDCPGGFDFTTPGFAMRLTYGNDAASRFFVSFDRGRAWQGPYKLPLFDQPKVMARTDYIVTGKQEMLVFLTAAKSDGKEGRVFCARTTDGAKTWKFVSFIGPSPGGFSIMPSTVRLGRREFLTAIRRHESSGNFIDLWRSTDNAATWHEVSRAEPDTGDRNGNPPSLVKLKDGRLALTYARRSPPYAILARISKDDGRTWSDEITVRGGGGSWDTGYTRTVQRRDGRLVTAYYFTDDPLKERFIGATIWDPGK